MTRAAISLPIFQGGALLHQQRSAHMQRSAQARPVQAVTLAVVDLTLAARLQSQAFVQRFAGLSLRISDTLDGESLLPGFTLPLAELFVDD